jgi:putative methionine-R-sulfoxide reductase with GAF domain
MTSGGEPTAGSSSSDPLADMAAHLPEMVRALFDAEREELSLERLLALAVEDLDGADFAGLFLVEEDRLTSPGASGTARELDDLQRELEEGPCIDAIAARSTVYAEDLATEPRWERFSPQAVLAGVRSVLSVSMHNSADGALNLYGAYPGAFGMVDRAKASILATLAAVALSTIHTRRADARRAENLVSALETRELVGQAQGILMERERITAEAAFAILRRASQRLNVKLREVAEHLVATGEVLDTDAEHGAGPP